MIPKPFRVLIAADRDTARAHAETHNVTNWGYGSSAEQIRWYSRQPSWTLQFELLPGWEYHPNVGEITEALADMPCCSHVRDATQPRTAVLFAAYYRDLLDQGVPDELAGDLVLAAAAHEDEVRVGWKALDPPEEEDTP